MRKRIPYLILILLFSFKGFSQNKLHLTFHKAKVIENTKSHTYKIQSNNKTVYANLKFAAYAEGSLQILTADNQLCYINSNLQIIEFPEKAQDFYCGTVDDFSVVIVDKGNQYIVEKTTNFITSGVPVKKEIIDSIPKKNIKDIYFLNKEKKINYDENFFFPQTVVISTKEDKIGIKSTGKAIAFFDEIDISNPSAIKVKKGDLWGYYNITDIAYKKLDSFAYNLASFQLKDGKKGFIDYNGNQYLK